MMVHETTELWSEPGRALVAEASSLLTRVDLRKGDALYLNDGSYGTLFDAAVRAVAARAHVAPATAYTYFSSKNHLVAEVYLDLVRQVPFFTDVNETRVRRVQQALRSLALVVADEPEVAAACTTALLSNDAAVRPVREQIGAAIHQRIKSALGPGADPRTVSALEMSYFGALVHAGSGVLTYRQIADRLGSVVGLILDEAENR